MNQSIRKIKENELVEYKKLLEDVFNNHTTIQDMKKSYKLIKDDENTHILGYFRDNQLVGTLTLKIIIMPSGKEATIWDLAVSKEYRRQGIASELMKKAETIVKEDKAIRRIWLFSGFHRKEAHELYNKLGYDENRDKAFVKTMNE